MFLTRGIESGQRTPESIIAVFEEVPPIIKGTVFIPMVFQKYVINEVVELFFLFISREVNYKLY